MTSTAHVMEMYADDHPARFCTTTRSVHHTDRPPTSERRESVLPRNTDLLFPAIDVTHPLKDTTQAPLRVARYGLGHGPDDPNPDGGFNPRVVAPNSGRNGRPSLTSPTSPFSADRMVPFAHHFDPSLTSYATQDSGSPHNPQRAVEHADPPAFVFGDRAAHTIPAETSMTAQYRGTFAARPPGHEFQIPPVIRGDARFEGDAELKTTHGDKFRLGYVINPVNRSIGIGSSETSARRSKTSVHTTWQPEQIRSTTQDYIMPDQTSYSVHDPPSKVQSSIYGSNHRDATFKLNDMSCERRQRDNFPPRHGYHKPDSLGPDYHAQKTQHGAPGLGRLGPLSTETSAKSSFPAHPTPQKHSYEADGNVSHFTLGGETAPMISESQRNYRGFQGAPHQLHFYGKTAGLMDEGEATPKYSTQRVDYLLGTATHQRVNTDRYRALKETSFKPHAMPGGRTPTSVNTATYRPHTSTW